MARGAACRWRTGLKICCLLLLASSVWGASGAKVKEIILQGNAYFSSGRLKGKMRTKEASFFHLRGASRVDEMILQQDASLLEAFYHKNGFLECAVTETVVVDSFQQATVLMRIAEGSQTTISRLDLLDLRSMPVPEMLDGLGKQYGLVPGAPLDVSQLAAAEIFVKNRLADLGYPFSSVQRQVSLEAHQAEVTFQVAEGPLVHVRDILYRGNVHAQKFIIRRELLFRRGDQFSRSRILESQQRIYSTGLFTYVNIEPIVAADDSGAVDMQVAVAERRKRWTGIRTGIGQQEELDMTLDAAGEWGHRNLYGTGRRISLEGGASVNVRTRSMLSNEYSLKFTEPWVLNTRTPLTVDLYFRLFKWELYDLQEMGGDLNLRHEFPRKVVAKVSFVYKRADVFNVPPELEPDILEQAGVDIVRKVTFGADRDLRDHPLYPSTGIHSQVYSEYAGGILGGNNNFYKLVASWSGYQKWFPRTVLAGRIKWGMAKEFGRSTSVPIYDRFYAGGANTVRGYVERRLGPLKDGKPIGGALLFLSNIEVRRQLWWRFGLSLFLDSGYLWENIYDFRWGDVRFSTGGGLQFFTPVGPLRVEYGHKLSREEGQKRGVFHISLLYAF